MEFFFVKGTFLFSFARKVGEKRSGTHKNIDETMDKTVDKTADKTLDRTVDKSMP